jgi:hypothetical protein
MSNIQVFDLQPTGWEQDPDEERWRLSVGDYLVPRIYVPLALFFEVNDDDKPRMITVLRDAISRTLSQTRHLCGTIEKEPQGGHSFVKKKDSTVSFVVQHLDDGYPALANLREKDYRTCALGGLATWCILPMTWGEKPEAELDHSPQVAAFKLSLIRGGAVFVLHHHHAANDVQGWAGMLHQLAGNAAAIWHGTPFPSWDPACLDWGRFIMDVPPDQQVDAPPQPGRHPGHRPSEWVLLHIPKSKAAALKKMASPPPEEGWVSTYDACMAMLWRITTRLRAALYGVEMNNPAIWVEAIDMRRRMPELPSRLQGNVLGTAMSILATEESQPTIGEIMAQETDVPLSRLARFIRHLTDGVTPPVFEAQLAAVAPIRDKTVLSLRTDIMPPLTCSASDWRGTRACEADFGFARPCAFRLLSDVIMEGLTLVYPPRGNELCADADEGLEFMMTLEKELLAGLRRDPDFVKWCEFRGVDG